MATTSNVDQCEDHHLISMRTGNVIKILKIGMFVLFAGYVGIIAGILVVGSNSKSVHHEVRQYFFHAHFSIFQDKCNVLCPSSWTTQLFC